MEFLKVKNLNFGYKSCPPLFRNLCCEVSNASFVHVNGISGSGKTTLFKIFAGFINAFYDKLEISDIRIQRGMVPYDRNIAMVFQRTSLWQHLSVNTNIKLAWDKIVISRDLLNSWMDQLEINKFKNKNCSKLSAGEQQRVEILRALASGKKILILDEPFAYQDKANLEKLIQAIEQFREITQGVVIFSTHSVEAKEYFSSQATINL